MSNIDRIFFLIIAFLVIGSSVSYADEHDAIYMKDSSIVRGYIIDNVPDSFVKILTVDDTMAVISYDLINGIRKEDDKRIGITSYGQSYHWIQPGFFARTGFLFPKRGDVIFTVGFDLSRAVIKNASMGIGAEFDNYPFEDTFLFYGDFKLALMNNDITPLLIADVGYATCFDGVDSKFRNGGFAYALGAGLQFRSVKNLCLQVNMLYKRQSFAEEIQNIKQYPNFVDGSHIDTWHLTIGLSI